MKKYYSLIKACLTSEMNIFKFKRKKDGKKQSILLPIFIGVLFMFSLWSNANLLFEKMAPLHLQFVLLSLFVISTSFMTLIEGIYKSGPLMFNCKDDQLLLSLPISKKTVLFIRIFKFYLFELIFNSLFMIPFIIAYIRWADMISWTFYLTSFIMLLTLPIIPIILSCIIGVISSSITSKFKYKNLFQIVVPMLLSIGIIILSFQSESLYTYIVKNATSINDIIRKLYYPAGVYADLIMKFDILKLLIYIIINIVLFIITIFILSKFYFKINSNLKKVTTSHHTSINKLNYESHSIYHSLIKKEINTFFKTPVFIVNAGFGIVLYLIGSIYISIKFNNLLVGFTDPNGMNISKDLIMSNISLLILALITITSYTTSITNSVISLEGRNLNILKSLPIKTKKILLSKVLSSLILTTIGLLLGDIILFIKFKINIIDIILLLVLSILIPLVSHFIGILINLKYPKLDFENSAEVVKQSMSSFLSVMIGLILVIVSIFIIVEVIGSISATMILLITTMIYILIDLILYLILSHWGVKSFNKLTV